MFLVVNQYFFSGGHWIIHIELRVFVDFFIILHNICMKWSHQNLVSGFYLCHDYLFYCVAFIYPLLSIFRDILYVFSLKLLCNKKKKKLKKHLLAANRLNYLDYSENRFPPEWRQHHFYWSHHCQISLKQTIKKKETNLISQKRKKKPKKNTYNSQMTQHC